MFPSAGIIAEYCSSVYGSLVEIYDEETSATITAYVLTLAKIRFSPSDESVN